MNEGRVEIRKISMIDFKGFKIPPLCHVLDLCGILIIVISKKGYDYTLIQMSELELKQTSALNVFHRLNKSYYSHIIMKVLELKKYEFMGTIVYIEEVSKPDYLVDVGTVKYCLSLEP